MNRRTFWTAALATAFLAASAGPTFAQGQSGRQRGSRGSILSIPEVQKELNLQQAQIDLIQALDRDRGQGGQRPDFRNMSREEREKYAIERRKEREKKLGEILDAKQMARYKQLELQRAGARALEQDEIAAQLKLSADQKSKIKAALTAEGEQMRPLFQSMGFGRRDNNGGNGGQPPSADARREAFQKMQDLRTATEAKLMGVLTDPQKKQFQTMQGAAFKFPERQFGRDRGQGGRDRSQNGQGGQNGQRRRPGGITG